MISHPSHWGARRAKYLLARIDERGREDLPLLSASSVHGVIPRDQMATRVAMPLGGTATYKVVASGDFVMSMGSFEKGIEYSPYVGLVSPAYEVLRPIGGVEPRYYKHLLKSDVLISHLAVLARGIRQGKTISYEDFAALRLPVPTLDEQRRIANFLDVQVQNIDEGIGLGQRQADLIGERRISLVTETVSKGLDPAAPLKASDVGWIGLMPSAWGLLRFGHILTSANAGEVIDKSWWGDGDDLLFTCARNPVASNFPSFPAPKRTEANDILVTRNGSPYIHVPPAGSIYSNVVQRVALPPDCNREWARYALEGAAASLQRYGVSIDTFNFGMWRSLRLPLPSRAEQDQIADYLTAQVGMIDGHLAEIARLRDLLTERKRALITAAVTGQIDVTTAGRVA